MAVNLAVGDTYQFRIFDNGFERDVAGFSLASTDEGVLTIDETGLITAISIGSSNIVATNIADSTAFLEPYEVGIAVHNYEGVAAKITTPEDPPPTSAIKITLEETYQIKVYDKGNVINETEFTFVSADEEVLTVDETGLVTPLSLGQTFVTITRTSDSSEKKENFQVGAVTHDYRTFVKRVTPLSPNMPNVADVVTKDTDNTHTTIGRFENLITGSAILMAGKARIPGATLPSWKFALSREVFGRGRIVAESPWYTSWPAGQVLTFVHPAIGLIEFLVGEEPVSNGQDTLIIGDPETFGPSAMSVSTVSSAKGVLLWDPAKEPVVLPNIDVSDPETPMSDIVEFLNRRSPGTYPPLPEF